MQNKKSLLQRLLVIYITFFIVLAAGMAHSFIPLFSRGYNQGTQLGNDIVKNWVSGSPRSIFILGSVPVTETGFELEDIQAKDASVRANVKCLDLIVEQSAPDASVMGLAFSSIGGSPWLYFLVMIGGLSYVAVIVLMFVIIHSLRRSIREERTLDKRNVWYIRAIGGLTIFSELCHDVTAWCMTSKAAELLAGTNTTVDTAFGVSYPTIIMGILILFTAEVFAVGHNLSEEQKLTI